MQPQMRGWLMASTEGTNTGIVPANYIKVLGRSEGKLLSKDTQNQLQMQHPAPIPPHTFCRYIRKSSVVQPHEAGTAHMPAKYS